MNYDGKTPKQIAIETGNMYCFLSEHFVILVFVFLKHQCVTGRDNVVYVLNRFGEETQVNPKTQLTTLTTDTLPVTPAAIQSNAAQKGKSSNTNAVKVEL